jgi:subtilisin family serine protease
MKKIIYLTLIIAAIITYQAKAGQYNFTLTEKLLKTELSQKEVAVFVKGNPDLVKKYCDQVGAIYKYQAGDISAIRCKLSNITSLAALPGIIRIEDNDLRLTPMNDVSLSRNHVLEVHGGFNLPQAYDGAGVVMGIIDEGIDFTHPDFRNLNGTSRIIFLWDQSLPIDAVYSPQPYGYGFEYTTSMIDTSVRHSDVGSHGTHVSGIACGNGLAVNNYKGVAPAADMIVVKMDLNVPDNNFLSSFVDAVNYVFTKAAQLGKPAVINASLGTYFGSHDGKDIQAQAIENLISAAPGRTLVCAAGNAGSAPIHVQHNNSQNDTSFTWLQVPFNPAAPVQQTYIQLWADSLDMINSSFSIGIDRVAPDVVEKAAVGFRSLHTQVGNVITDTLYDGNNRLGYVLSFADYNPLNNSYSIQYLITADSIRNINPNDTARYLWRLMTKGEGRIDGWCFDMIFDGLPDSVTFPLINKYKKPDTDQTIVSSFTCSEKVITVGAYTNRNFYTNVNNQLVSFPTFTPGQIASLSSKGPTRDGRIKPDITATGEIVLSSSVQSLANSLAATEPNKVAAGRKHIRSSGTSMSAPVVAGVAALYLQRYPTATWAQVKDAIMDCADQDAFTGTNVPNNQWGMGKVNAYKVIAGCTVGIDEISKVGVKLYPNPVSSTLTILFDEKLESVNKTIYLQDISGRIVFISTPILNETNARLDLSQLAPGYYSVKIESPLGTQIGSVIKQ